VYEGRPRKCGMFRGRPAVPGLEMFRPTAMPAAHSRRRSPCGPSMSQGAHALSGSQLRLHNRSTVTLYVIVICGHDCVLYCNTNVSIVCAITITYLLTYLLANRHLSPPMGNRSEHFPDIHFRFSAQLNFSSLSPYHCFSCYFLQIVPSLTVSLTFSQIGAGNCQKCD